MRVGSVAESLLRIEAILSQISRIADTILALMKTDFNQARLSPLAHSVQRACQSDGLPLESRNTQPSSKSTSEGKPAGSERFLPTRTGAFSVPPHEPLPPAGAVISGYIESDGMIVGCTYELREAAEQ